MYGAARTPRGTEKAVPRDGSESEDGGGRPDVGVLPRLPEVFLDGRRLRAPGAQGLGQTVERPAVPGIALQVLAVDRLGLRRPAGGQEDGAELMADGERPVGRLVVL